MFDKYDDKDRDEEVTEEDIVMIDIKLEKE